MNFIWWILACASCFIDLQCTNADHEFLRREDGLKGHARAKRSAQLPPPSPWKGTDWNDLGRKSIDKNTKNIKNINTKKAKNVIIFLGDGMGVTTNSVARLYKREVEKSKKLDEMYLEWEKFPFSSLVRTYNIDRTTPDSAATATAFLSGIKANLGTMGLNENVYYTMCYNVQESKVKSIMHKSIEEGKATGIVTNTRITHASPAGNYASTPNRDWEAGIPEKENPKGECKDIAYQLVTDDRNSGINVLFGGGARSFLSTTTIDKVTGKPGRRLDNMNLTNRWCKNKVKENIPSDKFKLIRSKEAFDAIDVENTDYVLGLFSDNHLSYELDRDSSKEPSLEEMTEKAIKLLQKKEEGFFLFVEGGNIDTAHHNNNAKQALSEVLSLEKAVKKALSLVDLEETLVVVTADHSHVFTMGGYALFQEPVLGFTEKLGVPAMDGKPYQQLFYANGPGQLKHRIKMTSQTTFDEVPRKDLKDSEDVFKNDYQQDTGIFTMDESHGADDVSVYATGPWSHLFQGTEEQSYVAHVMMYASCVGAYKQEAHCKS